MSIKRILVPVDLSEASDQALDFAINFAKPLDAEIVLLFVIEPLYHAGDLGLLLEEQTRLGRTELLKLERRVGKSKVRCKTLVQRGIPYVNIVAAAKRIKADLILMATHGRTGLSHFLLGSVAERVVRSAECPVLTLHPRAKRRGTSRKS